MQDPQVRYARSADGVSIAYITLGAGPPFVWFGVGPGGFITLLRIPEFRERTGVITRTATLIMSDYRGFGMSDRGPVDHSLRAVVEDLEAVVDATVARRFTLQAAGGAAIVATAYAAKHPERINALILLNGIIRGNDMASSWKRIVRLAEEDWTEATTWLARMNMAGYSSVASLEQTAEVVSRTSSQSEFLDFARAMLQWDASEFVQDVTAPALVTHYGTWQPLEACRRLAASLPNATFVAVEPEPGERTIDAAARAIRNFMRAVVPRDPARQRPAVVPSGTAIIFFADIVDSTALTERLGDTAFRKKARELDGTLRSVIGEHAGTPIEGKLLGDGVLATFTSASQAIAAALACGKAGDDGGLPLHLGLHAGDVIREDNNVFGGAVNIASRISGLSAPGEVLASQTVRDLARTSAGVSFEDRGEQSLRGVGEPVRVWAVRKASND